MVFRVLLASVIYSLRETRDGVMILLREKDWTTWMEDELQHASVQCDLAMTQ